VFHKGDYVRMKLSPNTRTGTVEGNKWERGHVQYLFRSDPRFSHGLPDVYLMEDELEHSQRPSDAEIVKINDLIRGVVLSLPELRTLCLVPTIGLSRNCKPTQSATTVNFTFPA
jgi:hypothetical protein